ncbi:MAG: hypothetical protein LCH77_04345 [Actinobacteria bacterium]|nr:hypothetical protein [Actinomycetota bacterium]
MSGTGRWSQRRPSLPTREEVPIRTLEECRAEGLTAEAVWWRVESGQWQRAHQRVYVTHNGPLDWITRASAALIAAGEGAVLGAAGSLYVHGSGPAPSTIDLLLPRARRITPPAGSTVRYADGPGRSWVPWPPRMSLESTVIHAAGPGTLDSALALVVKGTPLLRFGWPEVAGDPCATAAEVARFAASRGLSWPIHPCRRASCTLARAEGRIA